MHTLNTRYRPWTRGLGQWMGQLLIWACAFISTPWGSHWPVLPSTLSFILLNTSSLDLSQLDTHALSFGQWKMSGRDPWHFQAWHTTFCVRTPVLFPSSSLMPMITRDLGNHFLNIVEPGGLKEPGSWITIWRRATFHSGTPMLDLGEWEIYVSWLKSLRFRSLYLIATSIALTPHLGDFVPAT